jgi:hypothetical protein
MPATSIEAEKVTGEGSQGTNTYTGVLLIDLLDDAEVVVNPDIKNDILSKYVTVVGTDGYRSTFALGEIHPDFGDQQILVAYEVDGESLGEDGFARIVVPNDGRAGRWVSNISEIVVGNPGGE